MTSEHLLYVLFIPALATERNAMRETAERRSMKAEPLVVWGRTQLLLLECTSSSSSRIQVWFFHDPDFLVMDRNSWLVKIMVHRKGYPS